MTGLEILESSLETPEMWEYKMLGRYRVTTNGRTGVKKLSIDWELALSDTLKRRDRQEVFVEKISVSLKR